MFINSAFAANTETATEDASHGGGETHSETGHHGGGDYPGAFPPFDPATFSSQLLWLAITFGLFYFLMSRIAIPRIASILEVRHDRISQDLDEANRLKEEADAAHAAYEHELAEAKAKAHDIAREAADAAQEEANEKRTAVEAELNDKLAEAEKKIASIKEKAMAEVGTIAGDITGDIVQAMSGAKVTKAEITKAVKAVTGG